ncbi:MAG: hypothetical protein OSB43_17985 [Nocardioides sp.]|uniref:hypothetical protein n=1 Tax=Nocardioides sp. TaxID=35761 RepID=UPI0023A41CC4|nr:hypothetical protein [Nocardioides sp.]MDE0778174.1 hypothetical protein [Nocardioides sp.]
MTDELIEDAPGLWAALSARAGLQESSYDADLLGDIARALGLPKGADLAESLEGVSTDDLLRSVLKALQPFSLMLSELLLLFATIGAHEADDPNLRVRYGLDADNDFAFDLNAFREQEKRWVETTRWIPDLQAGPDVFWALLRSLDAIPGPYDSTISSNLRAIYRRGSEWPDALPATPASGINDIDRLLEEAHQVGAEVLSETRRLSVASGPALLGQSAREGGVPEGEAIETLVELHKDHWLAGLDEGLTRAAAQQWETSAQREDYAQALESALAAVPSVEVTRADLIDELLGVLSLPVWARRYELYSAWLVTLIVEGVGRDRCRFNVTDGLLSFSFGGSLLAWIDTDADEVELWAELRQRYAEPIGAGRQEAVQPDYTVTRQSRNSATSALLVVEAKQWARSGLKNFNAALTDYSGAHSEATVVLANYGPMSRALVRSPPDRCVALGHVRPDRPTARETMVKQVRSAVPPSKPAPPIPTAHATSPVLDGTRPELAEVALTWTKGGDLDLNLVALETARLTNYTTIRGATATDLVRLLNDDVRAPGKEVALVSSIAGPVEVWVHRYRGEDSFTEMGAEVRVRPAHEMPGITVRASPHLDTDWWYVGVLHPDGSWEQVDEPRSVGP